MTPTQHQPGDHVLVEAVVASLAPSPDIVWVSLEHGARLDTIYPVHAAGVRLVPVAPAPDTGRWSPAAITAGALAVEQHQPVWIDAEVGWDCGCNERGDQGPWMTTAAVTVHVAAAVLAAAGTQRAREEAARTAPALRADSMYREEIEAWADAVASSSDSSAPLPLPPRPPAPTRVHEEAGRTAPAPVDDERPEVVALCGSTRFRTEFVEVNRALTMQGAIVVGPGVFQHDGDPLTEAEKTDLDALHLRKIDLADRVHVVDVGGYIGESTRREIAYAESLGRPITYLSAGGAA